MARLPQTQTTLDDWVKVTISAEPEATWLPAEDQMMDTEEGSLQHLRQKLAAQLHGLQAAMQEVQVAAQVVSGKADTGSCSSSSVPLRRQARRQDFQEGQSLLLPDFLAAPQHYQQALEQARELYALTDADVSPEEIENSAVDAAQKDTLAEAVRLWHTVPQDKWPPGWADIMDQASTYYQMDQGKTLQVGAAVRELPSARRTTSTRQSSAKCADKEEETRPPPDLKFKIKELEPDIANMNRWQTLVSRIQSRKRWSARASLPKYARNGCPKNLDVNAAGFGRHLGRWQWREIAAEW